MSGVDIVLPKIETVKVNAYSKDTHLVPSDLALAIYSLMMLVNGHPYASTFVLFCSLLSITCVCNILLFPIQSAV